MPPFKFFLWAGAMRPGTSWRKMQSAKAGVEEASHTQERVQEVLEAPAWKTISRRFKGSNSEDMRGSTEIACPLRKLESQTRAHSPPPHRHGAKAKAAAKEGAGARLIDRVHQLRGREALATGVAASPKLPYSTYGKPVRKAASFEGFALPKKMPEWEEDAGDYHQPPELHQNGMWLSSLARLPPSVPGLLG
mmetsp:Transcript_13920/g.32339  ORF Transcript_13920/g.32339 Transcript_13920/m.32339 type:complete len:192 (-) Transcript_13920:118-693(-)